MHLIGLWGLNQCTTDNVDNLEAYAYSSGSVAHFGRDSGLGRCGVSQLKQIFSVLHLPSFRLTLTNCWRVEALDGPGTLTPESQNTICVDFYGDYDSQGDPGDPSFEPVAPQCSKVQVIHASNVILLWLHESL